ncbi:NS1 [Tilapia parvovirus]|nr:NS1 [Tilapia parvovirus]
MPVFRLGTGGESSYEGEQELNQEEAEVLASARNMGQWLCGVLHVTSEHNIDHVYEMFTECRVDDVIIVKEYNKAGVEHYHVLVASLQRSDRFRRGMLKVATEKGLVFDCVKWGTCRVWKAMHAYMLKDPEEGLYTSIGDYNWAKWCMRAGISEKYKVPKAEREKPKSKVEVLRGIILGTRCRTIGDVMLNGGKVIEKHLHIPGLIGIIQNCLDFYNNAKNWDLNLLCDEWMPNAKCMHNILQLHNINTAEFDCTVWKWITHTNGKRNTILLMGASNTGKTAFIRGLLANIPHGEIQNISSGFAFEDLVGAVIGVWEEPLISTELAEKAKLIFEGGTTSVPVKRKQPVVISNVPIIMTSNHVPWRWCENERAALSNRMVIFRFTHDMTRYATGGAGSTDCNTCRPAKRSSRARDKDSSGKSKSVVDSASTATGDRSTGASDRRSGSTFSATDSGRGSRQITVFPGKRCGELIGGHNREPPSTGGEPSSKRANTGGLIGSACTTAEYNSRPGSEHGSSNSGDGIQTGDIGELVSGYTEQRGDSRAVFGGGRPGSTELFESEEHPFLLATQLGFESELTLPRPPGVGGKASPTIDCNCVRVPSPSDWGAYLAYLREIYDRS